MRGYLFFQLSAKLLAIIGRSSAANAQSPLNFWQYIILQYLFDLFTIQSMTQQTHPKPLIYKFDTAIVSHNSQFLCTQALPAEE